MERMKIENDGIEGYTNFQWYIVRFSQWHTGNLLNIIWVFRPSGALFITSTETTSRHTLLVPVGFGCGTKEILVLVGVSNPDKMHVYLEIPPGTKGFESFSSNWNHQPGLIVMVDGAN